MPPLLEYFLCVSVSGSVFNLQNHFFFLYMYNIRPSVKDKMRCWRSFVLFLTNKLSAKIIWCLLKNHNQLEPFCEINDWL
jgi:hypothetical protein